jgi:flagellar protein FlaG
MSINRKKRVSPLRWGDNMSDVNNVKDVRNFYPLQAMDNIMSRENNIKSDKNGHNSQPVESQKISVDDAMNILKEKLEKLSKLFRSEAQFTFDRDIDKVIVKIKDKDTGEIIRQIPPEVAIKIAKKVDELIGILFDELA